VTAATSTRAKEAVAAGRRLLEEEGTAALTMRRLAERLGIRAPSLYKHLPDKAALEAAIIATGLEEAAEAFEAAVDGADEPLPALAAAYRGFAIAHPHLYRLMNNGPLPRQHLPPGLEDRTAAPSCGSPAARPAPAPCGRSPTAWSCSSSTTGSRPTPTWTAPGRPASPPSNRPDRRLGMVRPVVRGSDGRDGGARCD
jgi:predicted DNA-binding transcriptional regulator AlpA